MTPYKKYILYAVLGFALFLNFSLIPHLHTRRANRIVIRILEGWKNGNAASGLDYWQDVNKFPPIYNLSSYKIEKKMFGIKDNRKHAVFLIALFFPEDSLTPTDKKWACELSYTSEGWKVVDFYLFQE
ncbi:MAG: hypothetical protein WC552_06260 [Candidatus Omnitrophota bacterium]